MPVVPIPCKLSSSVQRTPRHIRRYGLYSSRTRGKWLSKPHVLRLAPAGWKNIHLDSCGIPESMTPPPDFGPSAKESQAVWARLLAQIYEVDPLRCRKCGSEMRVLAVITDPNRVRKILKHLIKIGRSPPGLDPLSLNWSSLPCSSLPRQICVLVPVEKSPYSLRAFAPTP